MTAHVFVDPRPHASWIPVSFSSTRLWIGPSPVNGTPPSVEMKAPVNWTPPLSSQPLPSIKAPSSIKPPPWIKPFLQFLSNPSLNRAPHSVELLCQSNTSFSWKPPSIGLLLHSKLYFNGRLSSIIPLPPSFHRTSHLIQPFLEAFLESCLLYTSPSPRD